MAKVYQNFQVTGLFRKIASLRIESVWMFVLALAALAFCSYLFVERMWLELITLVILAVSVWAWFHKKAALVREKPANLQGSFSDAYDIATICLIVSIFGLYVVARIELGPENAVNPAVFTGLLWSLACLVSGAVLGFLFGVPRVVQESRPRPTKDQQTNHVNAPPADSLVYQQRVNSNLEDISDWLTKIIVGVGLVELAKVYDYFNRAATLIGSALMKDTVPQAKSLGAGVIILFGSVGFLSSYLLTRLFLAGAFQRAERDQGPAQKV